VNGDRRHAPARLSSVAAATPTRPPAATKLGNARFQAFRAGPSLGLSGQDDTVGSGHRWSRDDPVIERVDLTGDRGKTAQSGRVDQDRKHAVDRGVLGDAFGPVGAAAAQGAAQQFAQDREAETLVIAHGQQRSAGGVGDHGRRVERGVALRIDHRTGRQRHTLVVGDVDLAEGDLAGGEVEHEGGVTVGRGHTGAERVGPHARAHAAPRGDQRLMAVNIDEMERDQALAQAHLGPMADTAQMVAVGRGDQGDAVVPGPFDASLHGRGANHGAEPHVAVKAHHRAAVEHQFGAAGGVKRAVVQAVDVIADHLDAVAVVARQVGLDQHVADGARGGRIGLAGTKHGSNRLPQVLVAITLEFAHLRSTA